jgi:hypothetical protein
MSTAFAMNVFKDVHLGEVCKASLQEFHPDDPFFVIPDSPRLKLPQYGGLWTKRYLEILAQTGCDYLIKIDPDQRVRGRIEGFPNAEIFGELSTNVEGRDEIVAHCMGWTLAGARKMLEADLWDDPKYKTERYVYTKDYSKEPVSLQDPIVMDIAMRLGMTYKSWHANLWMYAFKPPVSQY